MNQFVERGKSAVRVGRRDSRNAGPPRSAGELSETREIGVRDGRLAGARVQVVENAHLRETGAEVAIVAFGDGKQRLAGNRRAENSVGLPGLVVEIPRFDGSI